jgi:hypothetical protein
MTNLYKAKLAFQSEIASIERSSSVDFTTKDGRRKHYDYVDLAAVMDYALPKLSAHGLVLSSQSEYRDIFNERKTAEGATERVFVKQIFGLSATLVHAESGESESETIWHDAAASNDIKDKGALITYMRRYAVMTLLNLTAKGEDDDGGNGGAPKGDSQKKPEKAPQKQPAPAPAAKTDGALTKAEIKKAFEAIGLSEADMVSLRMANIGSMEAALQLYEKHGSDKVAMMKSINGEGPQEEVANG